MNATDRSGHLVKIPNCYLEIGDFILEFNNLPDVSDQKGSNYNDEAIPGRVTPIPTYAHSEKRAFSVSIILVVQDQSDCKGNLKKLRNIQSAVYPRRGLGTPYRPPVICKFQMGSLLSNNPICCIMKNYSAKFPTDVPWDVETLCPYKMEISFELEQVFAGSDLPNQDMILSDFPPQSAINIIL